MKLIYKVVFWMFTAVFLISGTATPAYAAKKKKIKSVSIKIIGNIEADTRPGEETLEISTDNSKYSVDSYEIENATFRWRPEDTPKLKVILQAEEDYYFDIDRVSQVKITGGICTNVRGRNTSTLTVEISLPPLKEQLYPVEGAVFSEDGTCRWNASEGAVGYEVKFFRNKTGIGSAVYTTSNTVNFFDLMTKEGNYYFKVRPVSINNPDVLGDWAESAQIFISKQRANEILQEKKARESAGTWKQDERGYWFVLPDGRYLTNEWRRINERWYYFLDSGYMATGWQYINGVWYYLDPTTGAMWANSQTPDGYFVGIDGTYIK